MEAPHTTDAGSASTPPPPPPPPFGTGAPRQLRRRPDQGHIAGVCAGVAEYFNVDVVIVRIAAVVLLFSGPGLIAYVLAWIFVPEAEGGTALTHRAPADGRDRGMQIFGIVLLVLAVSVLWGDWWSPGRRWLFPLGLMALGAWMLLRRQDGDTEAVAREAPASWDTRTDVSRDVAAPWDAPTDVADTTADVGSTPTEVADTTADEAGTRTDITDVMPATGDAGGSGGAWSSPPPPFPWGGPPPSAPELTAARRRRRMLGPVVMGTLLVWAGLAWLIGVSIESALAVGLCIVGVGFVLGAFVGGSWALIVPAAVIGAALIVTTAVDIPLSGGVGERTWTPQTISEVDDVYELSMGDGTLDLRQLALDDGDRLEIRATVGFGHLVIEVPEDVAVVVDAEVGIGETVLLGERNSGFSVSDQRTSGDPDGPVVELDLQAGIGQVEVRHLPSGGVTDRGSPEPPESPATTDSPATTETSLPR
jgi:phage shock protein PspC (stress-responsive transcriptional regulator)/predicted membrane protein